jgi:hypothetical protein
MFKLELDTSPFLLYKRPTVQHAFWLAPFPNHHLRHPEEDLIQRVSQESQRVSRALRKKNLAGAEENFWSIVADCKLALPTAVGLL